MSFRVRVRVKQRKLTFRGVTKPLGVWAREIGLRRELLYERVFRYGWSTRDALTVPVGGKPPASLKYSTWRKHLTPDEQGELLQLEDQLLDTSLTDAQRAPLVKARYRIQQRGSSRIKKKQRAAARETEMNAVDVSREASC